ncbi:MAG: homoserine kinase [Candidatus Thermoplasmatota archaeon]|nr:homoserine kinase [Candidatus Thermoplasmatota archaeon]
MKSVTAIAFSSSANLGPGFDVLSLCHDFGQDRVTVSLSENNNRKVSIVSINTPNDARNNSAGRAALEILSSFGIIDSITLEIEKGIPVSAGLGGSGSSAAAAVAAVCELFDLKMTNEEKIRIAGNAESSSENGRHYDNVAASTLGGLAIINPGKNLVCRTLKVHDSLRFVVVAPQISGNEAKTDKMRSLIPSQISRVDHIKNTSSLAFLISGLTSGKSDLISTGMNDHIFEPSRSEIYPFFYPLKEAAIKSGAIGVCLSGSGPSMLIVCSEDSLEPLKRELLRFPLLNELKFNLKEVHVRGGAYVV